MIHRLSGAMRKMGFDKWALTSVLALWAGMVSVVVCCIAVYGCNVPLAEDWDMDPSLIGQEPNLLEWLWAQNNEHRLPLQNAVYLVLLKASGGDFRIGMIANTLMLGGLSLAMILTARRLRGGATRRADAVFPMPRLHFPHWAHQVLGCETPLLICRVP